MELSNEASYTGNKQPYNPVNPIKNNCHQQYHMQLGQQLNPLGLVNNNCGDIHDEGQTKASRKNKKFPFLGLGAYDGVFHFFIDI